MRFSTIIAFAAFTLGSVLAVPLRDVNLTAAQPYVDLIHNIDASYRTINLTKHQEKEVNEELRDVWKIFGNGKPDWKHGSIPELLKGLESAAPVYTQLKDSTRKDVIEELLEAQKKLHKYIAKAAEDAQVVSDATVTPEVKESA